MRVLRLLWLIERDPERWRRSELADRFGVSERMIDLDLQLIRTAGYDVRRRSGRRGGGYYLRELKVERPLR